MQPTSRAAMMASKFGGVNARTFEIRNSWPRIAGRMLRVVAGAIRAGLQTVAGKSAQSISSQSNLISGLQQRSLSSLVQKCNFPPAAYTNNRTGVSNNLLLQNSQQQCQPIQIRTLIKFSMQKGKRKSVKAVVRRFKRLHWGGWIRTIAGRHRYLWSKTQRQKNRYQHHVLCSGTQSWLLDTMVTSFWRRPKYYVDDPYTPYHTRDYFKCRTKPK